MIQARKILEFRSFNEKSIFELESFKNSSMGISSDFFEETIIFDIFVRSMWTSFEVVFQVKENSSLFLILKKNKKQIAKRQVKGLQTMKEKQRIRLFKFDDETEVKNVFFFQNRPSAIHVILSDAIDRPQQYALFGDGFKSGKSKLIFSNLGSHVYYSISTFVNGRLHIFGGKKDEKTVKYHIFFIILLPMFSFRSWAPLSKH